MMRSSLTFGIAIAVILSAANFADAGSKSAISDRYPISTTVLQLAQAESPEVAAAAQALKEALAALAEAKANNGDIEAATRRVRRANRALQDALAKAVVESGDAEDSDAADASDQKSATDREKRRKLRAERLRKEMEAEKAAAEEEARKQAEAAAAAERERKRALRRKKRLEAERAAAEAEKAAAEEEARKQAEAAAAAERERKRALRRKKRLEAERTAAEAAKAAAEEEAREQAEAEQTGIKGETVDPKVRELRRKLRAERKKARRLEAQQQQAATTQESIKDDPGRVILRNRTGRIIIRNDGESQRTLRSARDVRIEHLPRGRTRTTIYKRNGDQIVTLRDNRDNIILRFRRDRFGNEYMLIDNRRPAEPPKTVFGFSLNLPPLVLTIPREDYVVDMDRHTTQERIYETLVAPPVERVERAYTLDEIRYNKRIRDKVRRIDLNAITFDSGSALISPTQIDALTELGFAIEELLEDSPSALILISGHTDAVGSDLSNLALSDRRAESVAIALSEYFLIPPENLITQGYGEEFLKIPTLGAERRNRRVEAQNLSNLMMTSRIAP